jgi:5-methylcytosine-specific restriction enzyme A
MPVAPKSGCLSPRCPHRAERRGRCLLHAREMDRERRERSGHSLYDSKWKAAAKTFLALPEHARCVYCGQPAGCVDHAIAHKGNRRLFWDRSNWRPSCLACNTKKGIREEGAFGCAFHAS